MWLRQSGRIFLLLLHACLVPQEHGHVFFFHESNASLTIPEKYEENMDSYAAKLNLCRPCLSRVINQIDFEIKVLCSEAGKCSQRCETDHLPMLPCMLLCIQHFETVFETLLDIHFVIPFNLLLKYICGSRSATELSRPRATVDGNMICQHVAFG